MDEEKPNYFIIIVLIVTFIVLALLFLGGFGLRSEIYRSYASIICPLRESLIRYHSLIGWDIYRAGGQPLVSAPGIVFFELAYFFYLIFNDPNIALSLGVLIYFSLGTIGMYLLSFKLTKSNKSSILSCIFFWFWISWVFYFKHIGRMASQAVIPWLFLLYLNMGTNTKKIIRNSIFMGASLTIVFLTYGVQEMLLTLFIFPIFLVIDLLILYDPHLSFSFRIKKLLLVLLIMFVAFAGLSAFMSYPAMKFMEKTSRSSAFSLNEFIGSKLEIKDFFRYNLQGIPELPDPWMKTGMTPLILILVGLSLGFKKRNFLKFFIICIITLIIATNLFSIAKLLVLVPVLNKARHVVRFGTVYHFSVAILIGLSFTYIYRYLAKEKLKKWGNVLFILLIILLSFELFYLPTIKFPSAGRGGSFFWSSLDKQESLKYLSNVDPERHRIHMLGKDWVEGGVGEVFFCNLGIETMDWVYGNAWISDYTTFTMLAGTNLEQAAKLWGILNTKYVTTIDPKLIEPIYTKSIFDYKNDTDYFVPGLKLIKKFPSCKECTPNITHLYENTEFLPRVFLVNKSILIIGEKDKLYNLYAFMLLNDNFEPRTTVLIGKENIKDEDLNKYSAIILSQQITQEEVQKLKQFKDSGGEIFPDIFVNENSINVEKLSTLLQEWNKEAGDIKKINEKYYSPNHRIYEVEENLKGFVVISETFYTYRDEWLATFNSQNRELYNADFVVSAVYLDNEKGNLEFKYNPIYFRRGSIISIITLCSIIFLFIFLKKREGGT